MSLLDRYVFRIVLGAFLAALLFFLFLSIVVDLLTNLPRYADRAAGDGLGGLELALYLALYYVKLMPVLFTAVTPFASVIAGMFTVARLQGASEIVPMLFVGRSIQRVLLPVLWVGVLGGGLMATSWQWVVPRVGASIATDEAFLRSKEPTVKSLVLEKGSGERQRLYVVEYDPRSRTMHDVALLTAGDLVADNTLVEAPAAVWDDSQRDWRLTDGWLKHARGSDPVQWLGRPDVTPQVLLQQSRDSIDPETLSYSDLYDLAISRPNRRDVRLAFHHHITFPLACVLMLLLSLPLAVRFERGGRIDRVLGAIGLVAGYMLLDLTCQRLGQRDLLHPVVAAWTPTIVFGSLGVVLFGGART